MKVLLCGVPYGRDNIGDEAILSCIVKILRGLDSEIDITVSTDRRRETAELLKVKTCPLFGFHDPSWEWSELKSQILKVDTVIWGGATGLSDYPEYALQIFELAIELGRKTAVFCTGMNDRLNPNLYEIGAGIKRDMQKWTGYMSFGLLDPIRIREQNRRRAAHRRISEFLLRADAVVVRDEETKNNLAAIGADTDRVVVACDPAIILNPVAVKMQEVCPTYTSTGLNCKKIGICISSQSPVRKTRQLAESMDRIILEHDADLFLIPMNPQTDAVIMSDLQGLMTQSHRVHKYTGSDIPAEVAGFTARMDLVISSRLHLLILATISHVPVVGISRGSKVDSFLRQLGLKSIGSVDNPNFELLENECRRLMSHSEAHEAMSRVAVEAMKKRLNSGICEIKYMLGIYAGHQRSLVLTQ